MRRALVVTASTSAVSVTSTGLEVCVLGSAMRDCRPGDVERRIETICGVERGDE